MTHRVSAQELRDVHAPGRQGDDGVYWQMAKGPDAVEVCVSHAALMALVGEAELDTLALFETNREYLCSVAAMKVADHTGAGPLRIDEADVSPQ